MRARFKKTLKVSDALELVSRGRKFLRSDIRMIGFRTWEVSLYNDKGNSYFLRPVTTAYDEFKSIRHALNSLNEVGVEDDNVKIHIPEDSDTPVKISDVDVALLGRFKLISEVSIDKTEDGYRVVGRIGKKAMPFFVYNTFASYGRKAYKSRENAVMFCRRKELPGFGSGKITRDEPLKFRNDIPFKRAERLIRDGEIINPVIKMTSIGEWETYGTYKGRQMKLLPLVKPKIKEVSYISPSRAISHLLNLGFSKDSIRMECNKEASHKSYMITEKSAIAFLYCDLVKGIQVTEDDERGYLIEMNSRYSDDTFVVTSRSKKASDRKDPYSKSVNVINKTLSRIGAGIVI